MAAAAVRSKVLKGMHMFKKGEKDSEAREKVKKETYLFEKTLKHGFPDKPTSIDFDDKLKLLAIATKNGDLHVVGAKGVEFSGTGSSVKELFFLPGQGRVVTITNEPDNSVRLWEINKESEDTTVSTFSVVKVLNLNGKVDNVTKAALSADAGSLYLGTGGGNVYIMKIAQFELEDKIIFQEKLVKAAKNAGEDVSPDQGQVIALSAHSEDPNRIVVGYNRLIAMWFRDPDGKEDTDIIHAWGVRCDLNNLHFDTEGDNFSSGHSDGSVTCWKVNVSDHSFTCKAETEMPHGPLPCKNITKVLSIDNGDDSLTIFSGGMPRAKYGEKHCVTVQHRKREKVVFDVSSKVIDFVVGADMSEDNNTKNWTLYILAEEELVCVDLASPDWPTFHKPYLNSLQFSALTASQYCGCLSDDIWENVVKYGNVTTGKKFSKRAWPVNGGKQLSSRSDTDILVTGHENGSVCLWQIGSAGFQQIYKLDTSDIFVPDAEPESLDADNCQPPFRRVGDFDPFSDDPRLAITHIYFSEDNGLVVTSGAAGQVVVFQLKDSAGEISIPNVNADIIQGAVEFNWKGHDPLNVKPGLTVREGYQPTLVVQSIPPAAITAMDVEPKLNLVAFGSSYGFSIFDISNKELVTSRCTLDGTADGGEAQHPRTLKQSLRESFRRLKKKPERHPSGEKASTSTSSPDVEKSGDPENKEVDPSAEEKVVDSETPVEAKPADKPASDSTHTEEKVVRVVKFTESKRDEVTTPSMIRHIFFAETFLRDHIKSTHTLWAGTQSGQVISYLLDVPSDEKRAETTIKASIAKDIKLKHAAPVIGMTIIDKDGNPSPRHGENTPFDVGGKHGLLLCSEEQIKIFHLPSLKPAKKHRLAIQDGSRVRKVGFATLGSTVDVGHFENCIIFLNNHGELFAFTTQNLKQQVRIRAIERDNRSAIASCIFTRQGEGFYLSSGSELQRFTLSAKINPKPQCMLELAEGMRPIIDTEVEEETKDVTNVEDSKPDEIKDEEQSKPMVLTPGVTTTVIASKHVTKKTVTTVEGGEVTTETIATVTEDIKTSGNVDDGEMLSEIEEFIAKGELGELQKVENVETEIVKEKDEDDKDVDDKDVDDNDVDRCQVPEEQDQKGHEIEEITQQEQKSDILECTPTVNEDADGKEKSEALQHSGLVVADDVDAVVEEPKGESKFREDYSEDPEEGKHVDQQIEIQVSDGIIMNGDPKSWIPDRDNIQPNSDPAENSAADHVTDDIDEEADEDKGYTRSFSHELDSEPDEVKDHIGDDDSNEHDAKKENDVITEVEKDAIDDANEPDEVKDPIGDDDSNEQDNGRGKKEEALEDELNDSVEAEDVKVSKEEASLNDSKDGEDIEESKELDHINTSSKEDDFLNDSKDDDILDDSKDDIDVVTDHLKTNEGKDKVNRSKLEGADHDAEHTENKETRDVNGVSD